METTRTLNDSTLLLEKQRNVAFVSLTRAEDNQCVVSRYRLDSSPIDEMQMKMKANKLGLVGGLHLRTF